jgi:hypothetical protein
MTGWTKSIIALVFVTFAASPILAANPHFRAGPVCVDNGDGTVTCTGDIAGLGNQNIDVVVVALGTTTCKNRGNKPPTGQEPSGLDTESSGSDSDIRVKNGRATFSVTTDAENPCPDQMIALTTFDSATLTVFQPAGSSNVVLEETFSF